MKTPCCSLFILVATLSGALFGGTSASAAVDARAVVQTAEKLASGALDTSASYAIDGVVLERPGLRVAFTKGRVFAVRRSDDRIVGAVFEGEGEMAVVLPAGTETAAWQAATDFSALSQPFTAANLRFSDATADELFGDRPADGPGDASGSAFRAYEARSAILDDPQWTRWAPNLLIDQLLDLYGGGHVGGHLLAEFRLASSPANASNWLSYLHNPRGALMPGETTSIFTARPRGTAPPELNVISSFGASPAAETPIDVVATDLDVTFPTRTPTGKDLVDVVVVADVQLVNVGEQPLKAVVLELERERALCTAQSDRDRVKVSKVDDAAGNGLAAIHRGSRLLIPLAAAVPKGGVVQLHIEYAGPMTQGIPYTSSTGRSLPDTFFSELGPWAWYPRNPDLDRFASRVEVHLPRFMRAVVTGDLLEEREEKDGWHYVFEEPGGVRNLTLVVGALKHNERKDQGANPRILVWQAQDSSASTSDTSTGMRSLVSFVSSVWGGYPYSTLHFVENAPYPAMNWQSGSDGRDGGGWSCIPPGQLHPWQGFVEGASGVLLSPMPVTAPAHDQVESRALDDLFVEPMDVVKYLQVTALTRQWWGHLVPPKTYRDLWIAEALAAWTATAFVGGTVGRGALKERMSTMQRLMVEGSGESPPLAVGERLGRHFPFQAWGRGPLLVNDLVEAAGSRPFLTGVRGMMARAAARGLGADLFFETLETFGGVELRDRAVAMAEVVALPSLEYTADIDKSTGEVHVRFAAVEGAEASIDVPVWVRVKGTKAAVIRRVRVQGGRGELRFTPEGKARKIEVDPMHTALVRKLKKVGRLSVDEETTP